MKWGAITCRWVATGRHFLGEGNVCNLMLRLTTQHILKVSEGGNCPVLPHVVAVLTCSHIICSQEMMTKLLQMNFCDYFPKIFSIFECAISQLDYLKCQCNLPSGIAVFTTLYKWHESDYPLTIFEQYECSTAENTQFAHFLKPHSC